MTPTGYAVCILSVALGLVHVLSLLHNLFHDATADTDYAKVWLTQDVPEWIAEEMEKR